MDAATGTEFDKLQALLDEKSREIMSELNLPEGCGIEIGAPITRAVFETAKALVDAKDGEKTTEQIERSQANAIMALANETGPVNLIVGAQAVCAEHLRQAVAMNSPMAVHLRGV